MLCDVGIGAKQPLLAFRKPLHEAATLPLSASQSLVNAQLSSQRELAMYSTHVTPDCVSSCCWLTPRFEVGSASCSTTPCSSAHYVGDDVLNATSPCSSVTSSSATRSSPLKTDITSVSVPLVCSEPCETQEPCETSASEAARLSDELVPSMHSAAECARPLVTSSTEPLHARSSSQELSD